MNEEDYLYEYEKEFFESLEKIKRGYHITFELGNSSYYFDYRNGMYCEYTKTGESKLLTQDEINNKIDLYLRRDKLEKIISKIC